MYCDIFLSTSLKTKQVKLHFYHLNTTRFYLFYQNGSVFFSHLIFWQHFVHPTQHNDILFEFEILITSECSWKRSNGVDCRRTRSVRRRCWLTWLLIILSYLCQNYGRFYFYNKNFSVSKENFSIILFVFHSFLKHVYARLFIVAHQQNLKPHSLFVTSWKFCWKIFVPNIN